MNRRDRLWALLVAALLVLAFWGTFSCGRTRGERDQAQRDLATFERLAQANNENRNAQLGKAFERGQQSASGWALPPAKEQKR